MQTRNLTIRKKLTMALVGVCAFSVMSSGLVFYFLIIKQHHQVYREEIRSLARMVGSNCKVALAFNIPEDAEQILASLSNHPAIVSAQILDSDEELFASYDNGYRALSTEQSGRQGRGLLTIRHEIIMNGVQLGTVVLTDDLRIMRSQQNNALGTLLIVVIGALFLTFLIADWVCNIISRPIRELAKISTLITEKQDYSLRANVQGAEEIANLARSFNNMLDEISRKNKKLLRSEQRFRTVVNQGVDSLLIHDLAGRFIDANQRACIILGYQKEELLNMTMTDIDTEFSIAQYRHDFWNNLFPESSLTMTTVFRCKDGTTLPVETRMGLLELEDKQYVMVVARDISERLEAEKEKEKLQSRLQHAQKMESVGTMAGGIAHDFNNILSAIFGYTELAKIVVEEGSELDKKLAGIYRAAERARLLVQQILTFSRRQEQEKNLLAVFLVVKEALKLLRSSIPTTIEIKQDIVSRATILADPTQIHQLVMNLGTNAYHAMQETGGVMTIGLHEIDIDHFGISGVDLPPGRYVKLEVSDNGCGMDEEARARIFEPYFTTKEQGKGTGLGLAVVHGIVNAHHGSISVYSELGKGTSFCVYLPVTDGEALAEFIKPDSPPAGDNERIMVVDDEEAIRHLVQEELVGSGYRVDTFVNGRKAWESFRKEPFAWDIIVTDQTMPEMTGAMLAEKAIQLRPEMPVILCSGYNEMVNGERASNIGITSYLQKPVTRNDLLRNVSEALKKKRRK